MAGGPVEGPWALPKDWRWERLGDLGTWSGGGTPSKARPDFWTDGTIPWVSPKDMKRPVIDSTEDRITPAAVASSATKLVEAGAVLCVMRSGILRHTFPVAVAAVDVTLNQDMRALTPSEGINASYLAHYLRSSSEAVLRTASKQGTTVNSIEGERLNRHPVPVPPLDVQRRIVGRIDELFTDLDDGKTLLGRASDDIGTWRKALLKAAVTGELTADWRAAHPPTETGAKLLTCILDEHYARWLAEPRNKEKRYAVPTAPDICNLPSLPESWTWTTVAALLQNGIQNGLYLPKSAYDGETPIMRIDDFQSASARPTSALRRVDIDDDIRRTYSLCEGDYVINRVNSLSHLGKSFLVRKQHATALFESNMMRMRPSSRIDGEFLEMYLASDIGRECLCRNAKAAVNQASINQTDVGNAPVPLPPQGEQVKIVDVVRSAFTNDPARQLTELNEAGMTLRRSILSAVFRGDLVA